MKKLLTPLLALAAVFFFMPQTAEARSSHRGHSHKYVSGHTSCGCKIYTKRVVRYYDCSGYPVYGYYRQPVKHRCHRARHHRHHVDHYSSHRSSRHYKRSRYNSCGSRSGFSISYGNW